LLDQPSQAALRIAALVMVEVVVRRPHPLVRRNCQQKRPAGFQAGAQRGNRRAVVLDVLDDIERRDEVVGAALDPAQFRERGRGNGPPEPFLCDRSRFRVDLDSVG